MHYAFIISLRKRNGKHLLILKKNWGLASSKKRPENCSNVINSGERVSYMKRWRHVPQLMKQNTNNDQGDGGPRPQKLRLKLKH